MPYLIKLFLWAFFVFAVMSFLRMMWPQDHGRFSNFEKSKNPRDDEKPKAKKGPALIGTRFPTANMSDREILDLEGQVTKESIQKAFRKKVQEFHPDRFATMPLEEQNLAQASTLLITKARNNLLKKLGN